MRRLVTCGSWPVQCSHRRSHNPRGVASVRMFGSASTQAKKRNPGASQVEYAREDKVCSCKPRSTTSTVLRGRLKFGALFDGFTGLLAASFDYYPSLWVAALGACTHRRCRCSDNPSSFKCEPSEERKAVRMIDGACRKSPSCEDLGTAPNDVLPQGSREGGQVRRRER